VSTDVSEKGLELLIVRALTGLTDERITAPIRGVGEPPRPAYGDEDGGRYALGHASDYDRDHALDPVKLLAFIEATQPEAFALLSLGVVGPGRAKFLDRVQSEVAKRGIVDVLRRGVKHGAAEVQLFYGAPSSGNQTAAAHWEANIFSVTRQLRYSKNETRRALDLAIFVNGLPVATFELKNSLTKQTVADAVQQYKLDRDPRELLFQFNRCLVHFAVDDGQVMFCTRLAGGGSWFLPFNKGYDDGAGNPPNPHGLKTDYLWNTVLSPRSVTDILENYAQYIVSKDDKTGRKNESLIFPRYHQLDVVRRLLQDAAAHGAGRRYLIQHSAGSGKSNSIAWLAHQLVGLEHGGARVFDSVVVVTDRVLLDKQIRDTIKGFSQVGSIVGHAEHSGQLKEFLRDGKKIIITTVQKFPYILDDIGDLHRDRTFAIIIDEAHSSQSGRNAAGVNMALADADDDDDDESTESKINAIIAARKMLDNASYFAFTATPKNKTLETFGGVVADAAAEVKRRPFHSYTMKQAIQEGFILDVLAQYTRYQSYYNLIKKTDDDPEVETFEVHKELKKYVERHEYAIKEKAAIMVAHFHEQVIAKGKIGGQARAMVVTGSIANAIDYFRAVNACLAARKSPYKAIVAFSGEHDGAPHEYSGKITEASLNGFPSNKIEDKIQEDPYRFLICADKFQTGYDEPLLHTMYVDKLLSGIKAVQTLSRLNRARPGKNDVYVLDFYNDQDAIAKAFAPFYHTTILSGETDPDKLHDLQDDLDGAEVYSDEDVQTLVERYLAGEARDRLDPLLDACVERYKDLDEDDQVAFKGAAKAFTRTYSFLASLLTFSNASWEKLNIFLGFLTPKLPSPEGAGLGADIIAVIDMESYRPEARATIAIALPDSEGEIGPVPIGKGGKPPESPQDYLSNIIKEFNAEFGSIEWKDEDKIHRVIAEDLPATVAADPAYQNAMKNSDKENARIELDSALTRAMVALFADHTDLYKLFVDNDSFKKWLSDKTFGATYKPGAP